MKRMLLGSLFLFHFAATSYADGCDGILSIAPDLTFNQTSVNLASSIYRSECRGSARREDRSLSAGLDVVIDKVPAALKLASGSTEQKVEHLCKLHEQWREDYLETVSLATRTNDKVYESWVACKALENEDVFFSVSAYPEVVVFGVRRGPDIINFLGMEYNPEHLTCFGPFGRGGAEVMIDRKTRYTLQRSVMLPITCARKLQDGGEVGAYYPSTTVAIRAEGKPPLVVPLPREEKYEPAFASEVRTALSLLQARIDDLERQSAKALGAAISKQDAKWRAGVGRYVKRKNLYRIDFNPPFPEMEEGEVPTLLPSLVEGHFNDGLSIIVKNLDRFGADVKVCRGGNGCSDHAHYPILQYVAYFP